MGHKFPEVDAYGQEALTAIAVVAMRAANLDDYLIHFMSVVSGLSLYQTRAIFHSSQNSKARLDMLRALVNSAGYSEARQAHALHLLDQTKALADKRNEYLHWQYMVATTDGDAPAYTVMVSYKPATKKPHHSRRVNVKEIENTADAYAELRRRLWDFYCDVAEPKVPGLPSRGTPD